MKKLFENIRKILNKGNETIKAVVTALVMAVVMAPVNVYAAPGASYLTPLNNLKTIFIAVVGAAGAVVLLWGIVRFGMAFQKHDQNAEYGGIYTIAAGAIMVGASAILTALGV